MTRPTTKVELQRFLGCVNFFHRFLPGVAAVLAPLHALASSVASQKACLSWESHHADAFAAAKTALFDAVRLAHPDPDVNATLSLTTDASLVAVGAVLSQGGVDGPPLAFFSKKLSPTEMKYSAFDRELLGVFLSIRHFRHLLEGRPFTIWTDHKPLCGALSSSAEKSPRQTRHLSYISEFSSDIRHVAGAANVVADVLSRPPSVSTLSSPALPTVVALPDIIRAQQASLDEMRSYLHRKGSNLRPVWSPVPGASTKLLCDTSGPSPRPIIPRSLVERLLRGVHDLSHAGGNATLKSVRRRYVWAGMASSVKSFCRTCIPCQKSKITRHTKSPLAPLAMPDARFTALHLDIVGPLPQAAGFSYLLTVIDRYSRWLEAIPLISITAQDCALALLRHWVSRFGVPSSIATDRGRQFTGTLWAELTALLGISRTQTTAYHPQSNGLIERQHRTLKERLMSRAASSGSGTWYDHLPFVLLGMRTSIREDSGCCPADLLYGAPLRLPGDSFEPSEPVPQASDFARQLRSVIGSSSPMPVQYHGHQRSRVDQALLTASHVFLRVDAVRRPLVQPYLGPFSVLQKKKKTFIIDQNGKAVTVSVDRLKPAHLLPVAAQAPPRVPPLAGLRPVLALSLIHI